MTGDKSLAYPSYALKLLNTYKIPRLLMESLAELLLDTPGESK